jgi:hypothetical protein
VPAPAAAGRWTTLRSRIGPWYAGRAGRMGKTVMRSCLKLLQSAGVTVRAVTSGVIGGWLVGSVGAAVTQPAVATGPSKADIHIVMLRDLVTGESVSPESGPGRPGTRANSSVVFDNLTRPAAISGLNVSYVDPAAYWCNDGNNPDSDCSGVSGAAYIFPMSPMGCGVTGLEAPLHGADNRTDVIWNEYRVESLRWPSPGSAAELLAIHITPYIANVDNLERENTLYVYIVGDPESDPNQVFAPLYGAIAITYRVPADAQDGYFDDYIDLSAAGLSFDIPEQGYIVLDWDDRNGLLNNTACGLGYAIAGGRLNDPLLPPQNLVAVGTVVPESWWAWSRSAADEFWDGLPGVSILDVTNTPMPYNPSNPTNPANNPNWSFVYGGAQLTHDFPFKLVVTCRECPNDPTGTECDTDINCDCVIDNRELQALLDSWAKTAGQPGFDPLVDYNFDGLVDNFDLQDILDDWANDCR